MNEVEDFLVDGKKYSIRFVEDLEFGFADDACLVEYEEGNESQGSELGCELEDVSLVENLVNQLHVEWSTCVNEMRMSEEERAQEVSKLKTSFDHHISWSY